MLGAKTPFSCRMQEITETRSQPTLALKQQDLISLNTCYLLSFSTTPLSPFCPQGRVSAFCPRGRIRLAGGWEELVLYGSFQPEQSEVTFPGLICVAAGAVHPMRTAGLIPVPGVPELIPRHVCHKTWID